MPGLNYPASIRSQLCALAAEFSALTSTDRLMSTNKLLFLSELCNHPENSEGRRRIADGMQVYCCMHDDLEGFKQHVTSDNAFTTFECLSRTNNIQMLKHLVHTFGFCYSLVKCLVLHGDVSTLRELSFVRPMYSFLKDAGYYSSIRDSQMLSYMLQLGVLDTDMASQYAIECGSIDILGMLLDKGIVDSTTIRVMLHSAASKSLKLLKMVVEYTLNQLLPPETSLKDGVVVLSAYNRSQVLMGALNNPDLTDDCLQYAIHTVQCVPSDSRNSTDLADLACQHGRLWFIKVMHEEHQIPVSWTNLEAAIQFNAPECARYYFYKAPELIERCRLIPTTHNLPLIKEAVAFGESMVSNYVPHWFESSVYKSMVHKPPLVDHVIYLLSLSQKVPDGPYPYKFTPHTLDQYVLVGGMATARVLLDILDIRPWKVDIIHSGCVYRENIATYLLHRGCTLPTSAKSHGLSDWRPCRMAAIPYLYKMGIVSMQFVEYINKFIHCQCRFRHPRADKLQLWLEQKAFSRALADIISSKLVCD